MKKKTIVLFISALVVLTILAACSGAKEERGISIKSVTLAEDLDADYQAVNPTTQFSPDDTINVSVNVDGVPKSGILTGEFYYWDQLISDATVDFATVSEGVIVSIGEDTFVGFYLTPSTSWPVDTGYHFDLYVDDVPVGSYDYEVIQ